MCLVFESAIVLSPFVDYGIEFKWDDCTSTYSDSEYPKSIMTVVEKGDLCTLTFDRKFVESYSIGNGSILSGVEYAVLS